MCRLFIFIIYSILFIGCNSPQTNSYKKVMFQSVSQEKATLLQNSKTKEECPICGMNLVKYYKTSHSAEHNSKTYQYCSIHCLEEHLGEGIDLVNPQVVDIKSLKFIPVMRAYYVVGSSKKGTMSMVSKYAFSTKKDADKFVEKFGGKVMNFNKARAIAQDDFKHYKSH